MTDAAAVELAHEIFDPLAASYLERDGVDIGPMFGSEGLRIRGKVFAFVGYRGALVVKLPAERVDALDGTAGMERMVMRERAMREWMLVPASAGDRWDPLLAEAFAFVDSITP
ncbi:hypothetical protein [Microbacterium sp. Root180]|uniref:hypothetical protein n=1 Tax=Microbacterium sp. Root180 TaxID=1736483 RepID=UPI0006F39224|nr:hypothetical protein [Microbacterium sp. Root180]KRB37087.1 hypothetical protein ASD93_13895 [Microbacterium sp. Root180]